MHNLYSFQVTAEQANGFCTEVGAIIVVKPISTYSEDNNVCIISVKSENPDDPITQEMMYLTKKGDFVKLLPPNPTLPSRTVPVSDVTIYGGVVMVLRKVDF